MQVSSRPSDERGQLQQRQVGLWAQLNDWPVYAQLPSEAQLAHRVAAGASRCCSGVTCSGKCTTGFCGVRMLLRPSHLTYAALQFQLLYALVAYNIQ